MIATAVVTIMLAKRAAGVGRTAMARWGAAVAAIGLVGAAVATDAGSIIAANIVLGAGLGAVYAAATSALAAFDDPDRASAVAVSGTVVVTALLIVGVSGADRAWSPGTGFAVLALCCVPTWLLMRRLPKSRNAIGGPHLVAPKRPSVVLLAGAVLLWMVTQGAWSHAAVLGREHTGMSPAAVSAVLATSSVVALAGAVVDPSGRWTASLGGVGALGNGVGPLAVGHLLSSAGPGALAVVLAAGTVVASLPLLRMTVTARKPVDAAAVVAGPDR